MGPQCDDGRVDAWGRAKGARRHPPHDARLGEGLDEDRQIAALAPFLRSRADAPRDLELHEDGDQGRTARVHEKALEERRGDLVREIRDDPRRRARAQREEVDAQRIRADDADVVVTGQCLLKHGDHARVDLDRGDRPRTLGEGRGQDARPRPDLEHLVARPDLGRLDDRGEHRTIDEETLAQRGRGADTVTAERIAQPTRIRDIH